MLFYQGLSQIHAIPQKTSADAEHYVENILKKFWIPVINRTATTGSVLKRCMVPAGRIAFSRRTALRLIGLPELTCCQEHLPSFWVRSTWPGHLSNFWVIAFSPEVEFGVFSECFNLFWQQFTYYR